MRRAVLFDFGGVILTSPFEAFAAYERRHSLPDGFLRRVNQTNSDTNAWARLERSEITVSDFDVAFANESGALGYEVRGVEVLGLLAGEVRPEMVAALGWLRNDPRFTTGLLTNNFLSGPTQHLPPAWESVLAMFDVVVESSRVGVRKPDVAFYEIACAELGIEPSEAVFLDDLGINLKPAAAMGMATVKVTDPLVALEELAVHIDVALSDLLSATPN